MLKIIRKIMYILHTKYVLGKCKKCCLFCNYRNECFDNLEYEDSDSVV